MEVASFLGISVPMGSIAAFVVQIMLMVVTGSCVVIVLMFVRH